MVYPQIHISRKLSHFLTTLGVKAVLRFLEVDFCCLRLFFCIPGAFRLWKFARGKGQSELCHDGSSSVFRIGRKENLKKFPPPPKKEEIIDMALCWDWVGLKSGWLNCFCHLNILRLLSWWYPVLRHCMHKKWIHKWVWWNNWGKSMEYEAGLCW